MTAHSTHASPEADQQTVSLLTHLVRALVDEPNEVAINPVSAEQVTIFEIRVEPEDVRRVIGRKGRTADALREILRNVASKAGRRYHLEIVEPENRITVALKC